MTSLAGAVVYGLATLENPHAAVLALAYLGQSVGAGCADCQQGA